MSLSRQSVALITNSETSTLAPVKQKCAKNTKKSKSKLKPTGRSISVRTACISAGMLLLRKDLNWSLRNYSPRAASGSWARFHQPTLASALNLYNKQSMNGILSYLHIFYILTVKNSWYFSFWYTIFKTWWTGIIIENMQIGCPVFKAYSRIMWPVTQTVCPPLY